MIFYAIGLFAALCAGLWFIVAPPKNKAWVNLFLASGGALLITIIFTHILPELFESVPETAGIALLVGFIIQIILENFSNGIEHGHSHISVNNRAFYLSFVALCVHAFIEGMPLAAFMLNDQLSTSQELLIGIVMHKIPVAITLAMLLIKSGIDRTKSVILLLAFVLSTPFGSAAQIMLSEYADADFLFLSLALTVGILLHVSTTILFESSDQHRLSPMRILAITLGILVGFSI